jgi:predicted O-methyltransferase YrrM
MYFKKDDKKIHDRMFNNADVLQVHHRSGFLFKKRLHEKKKVLQHHNDVYPSVRKPNKSFDMELVVAQIQPKCYPHAYYVPNLIDINDSFYRPVADYEKVASSDRLRVYYNMSYSDEKDGSPWDKGHRYIVPVLRRLQEEGYIEAYIAENAQHKDMIEKIRGMDICVSTAHTETYGVTTIEAMSMGHMIMCDMNQYVQKNMLSMTATTNTPFYPPNKFDLYQTILHLCKNHELVEEHKRKSREWVESYWNPADMIEWYIEIYNRVLGNTSRKKKLHTYTTLHNVSEDSIPDKWPTSPKAWIQRTNAEYQGLLSFVNKYVRQSDVVVEVGSYMGDSTLVFAARVSKVYAVDPWIDDYDKEDPPATRYRMCDVEREFDRRAAACRNVAKIKTASAEAAEQFGKDTIDVVYIDGCHTYEAVKTDITAWYDKVKPGGIISGHDFYVLDDAGRGELNPVSGLNEVGQAVVDTLGYPIEVFRDHSWVHTKGSPTDKYKE